MSNGHSHSPKLVASVTRGTYHAAKLLPRLSVGARGRRHVLRAVCAELFVFLSCAPFAATGTFPHPREPERRDLWPFSRERGGCEGEERRKEDETKVTPSFALLDLYITKNWTTGTTKRLPSITALALSVRLQPFLLLLHCPPPLLYRTLVDMHIMYL